MNYTKHTVYIVRCQLGSANERAALRCHLDCHLGFISFVHLIWHLPLICVREANQTRGAIQLPNMVFLWLHKGPFTLEFVTLIFGALFLVTIHNTYANKRVLTTQNKSVFNYLPKCSYHLLYCVACSLVSSIERWFTVERVSEIQSGWNSACHGNHDQVPGPLERHQLQGNQQGSDRSVQ